MMMETENDEEEDVGKWTRGKNSNGEIRMKIRMKVADSVSDPLPKFACVQHLWVWYD